MNKTNLSNKLNWILKELKMNKTEFIKACNKVNKYISKPTILNAINGNSKGLPKLETIDTIIKVCKASNNEKIKNISYDYLMNEDINNISEDNIQIGKNLYLSDKSIAKLKNSYMMADTNIISDFIDFIPEDFWEYQSYIKNTCNIQRKINISKNFYKKIQSENIFSLVELYCDFKKSELKIIKQEKTKKQYKDYLLNKLYYKDIFDNNYSIEELEESLIELYRSFSGDLQETFENYLNDKMNSNKNYSNEDMKNFENFLLKNNKFTKDNSMLKYIDSVKDVSYSYVSAYLLEYLRKDFMTQHRYMKDKRKLYSRIELYIKNSINIPKEILNEINNYYKEFYNSLDIFNKYLQLLILDSLTIYYKKLQTEKIYEREVLYE